MVLNYLLLVLVQVLFSINFIAVKIVLKYMKVENLIAIRFLLVTLLLSIFLPLVKSKKPKFSLHFLSISFLLALLGYTLSQGFMITGLKYSHPSNIALLTTLVPIITLLIVVLKGDSMLTWKKSLGFCLSFLAVMLLQDFEALSLGNETLKGDLIAFAGVLALSIFLGFSQKFLKSHHPLWVNTVLFACASVQTAPFIIFEGQLFPDEWNYEFTAALIYCVVGGNLLAYTLANFVLTRVQAELVSVFAYLQPILVALLAFIILDNTIDSQVFISSAMLLVGFKLASDKSKNSS